MLKPITLFAVGLILLFGISLFAVVLSVPGSPPTPVPTPATGVEGASFSGSGRTQATVTALSSQFLIACNATEAGEAVKALEALPEFESVFQVSDELFAASLNSSLVAQNESLAANASAEAAFNAAYALSEYCTPRLLQRGAASFNESFPLSADDGSGANKTLFVRDIDSYGAAVGIPSQGGATAYLVPGTPVGSQVEVLASAQLSADGRITQWFAQQARQQAPRLETVVLESEVEEIEPVAGVQAPVAWEARGFNEELLRSELNSSTAFSLESFSYSAEDSIVVENTSSSTANSSVELLAKQPFVENAVADSADSTRIVVFVQRNYSNAAGFRKLLQDNRVAGTPFFPNSTISATISFANSSFENASQAASNLLGPDAAFTKQGLVRILGREAKSRELGIVLPARVRAQLNPGATAGQLANVEFTIIAQGSLPLQLAGREV